MADEIKTVLGITAVVKFCSLDAPSPHPDFPEGGAKYRIECATPKTNTEEIQPLLAAVQYVAQRTWTGGDAQKKLRGIMRTIKEGDGSQSGVIGLLDGDEFKPEYNAGTYVLRASAHANKRPVYRRWDGQRYAITDDAPKPGDLVKVLIEVWAMKQHPRMNFTIKAVQVMKGGEAFMPLSGGQPVTDTMLEEGLADTTEKTLSLFEGMRSEMPALPAGGEHGYDDMDDAEDIPAEPAPVPAKKRGRPAKTAEPVKKAAPEKAVAAEVLDPEDMAGEARGGEDLFDGLEGTPDTGDDESDLFANL